MPSKLKPSHNYKYITSMLPYEYTRQMVRIKSTRLKAEFLVFPNRLVFSYPIALRLPKGTGRAVKQRLDRELLPIEMEYKPRYTLEQFITHPYSKEISESELDEGDQIDQEYVDTVNILWYLGHRCTECDGYRTDVGFDAESKIVYQCLECGHIAVDVTETFSAPGWVTNLMGGELD